MLRKKVYINQAYYVSRELKIKLVGSIGKSVSEEQDKYHLPDLYTREEDGSFNGKWVHRKQDAVSADKLKEMAYLDKGYVLFRREPVNASMGEF